jgi:integrase/recombinase XerD
VLEPPFRPPRDVDLDIGVLTIRDTKFGKSRQLPLHPTTTKALAEYGCVRDRLCPIATGPSFFVSIRASRPDKSTIQTGFRQLRTAAQIAGRPGADAPRLHDFRHGFAVQAVLDWHRTGVDVQARMLWLATYMGHSKPASSYWYLSAAPELLALTATRLETTLEALA